MPAPDAPAPAPPRRVDATGLRACPFCGSAPVWEEWPACAEAARIACGGGDCPVRPATEYLLHEYQELLREAWNRRR